MMHYKRLIAALAALILTAGMALAVDDNPQPAKRYAITDHGALGDGQTINTKAIQAAIDKCCGRWRRRGCSAQGNLSHRLDFP